MGDLPKLKKARLRRSQKDSDDFHMMLGYCIVAWAEVDELLFRIFRDCVGPYEQCAIIYYKTPSQEARFSLTNEIVLSVLPKKKPGAHEHPNVTAWNKTIEGYSDLLAVRRRLAHHPTTVRMNIRQSGAYGTLAYGQFPYGTLGVETAFSWVESHMSAHSLIGCWRF